MPVSKRERNRRTQEAAQVCTNAYNNPNTLCCNCHNPLHLCGPRNNGLNINGTPCTWDAGHPDNRWSTPELRPECSHCNRSRGATTGNTQREPHTPW